MDRYKKIVLYIWIAIAVIFVIRNIGLVCTIK